MYIMVGFFFFDGAKRDELYAGMTSLDRQDTLACCVIVPDSTPGRRPLGNKMHVNGGSEPSRNEKFKQPEMPSHGEGARRF